MTDDLSSAESSRFWNERKPAAVLKHALLRRYLPVFVSKTGSTSRAGRVVYFDGYAGEGRYEDGAEGSPLIAVQVARDTARMRTQRHLDIFLTEKSRTAYQKLCRVLDSEATDIPVQRKQGDVVKYLDDVIRFAASSPLFAFVDPYGTGLSFDTMIGLLNREPPGAKTEVLINFSAHLVRRVDRDNEKKLANIDMVCGGPWWREGFLSAPSPSRGTDHVVSGYRRMVCQAARCASWVVPVRNHNDHEPVYYLVFFSRHRDGIWWFGESLSTAAADWRRACVNRASLVHADQDALFSLDDPFESAEQRLEERWISTIKRNITALLEEDRAPFLVRNRYSDIMGESLGLARSKHIRAAVKHLFQTRLTSTNGVGDVEKMVIRPARHP